MRPKISVIVPFYKAENYLRRCLDSIICQTLQEIEIILVDDGSPDNSLAICEEYAQKDNRIKVISNKNRGLSYTRNAGLDIATGEFISFVDADDWIESEMMGYLLEMIDGQNMYISSCGHRRDDTKGNTLLIKIKEPRQFLNREEALSIKYLDSFSWGKLFPAWLFRTGKNSEPGIRFDEDIHHSEDLLFNCECMMQAKGMIYDTEPYYHYIQHSASLRHVPFNAKQFSALDARLKVIALAKSIHHVKLEQEAKCDYIDRAAYLLTNIYFEKSAELNKWYVKKLRSAMRKYFYVYMLSEKTLYEKLRTIVLPACPELILWLWRKFGGTVDKALV